MAVKEPPEWSPRWGQHPGVEEYFRGLFEEPDSDVALYVADVVATRQARGDAAVYEAVLAQKYREFTAKSVAELLQIYSDATENRSRRPQIGKQMRLL